MQWYVHFSKNYAIRAFCTFTMIINSSLNQSYFQTKTLLMRIETFLVSVDLAVHKSPVCCSAVPACFAVLCGRWFYEDSAHTSETPRSSAGAFGVEDIPMAVWKQSHSSSARVYRVSAR